MANPDNFAHVEFSYIYLSVDCLPISAIASERHLQSARTGLLPIPRTTTTLGMRSFVVAGGVIWNSWPAALWTATLFPPMFTCNLKAHLFGWSTAHLRTRDGPKFGTRRSSAEAFGSKFGSARCDYANFGKHSASFVASHLRNFALAAGVN